MSFTFTPEQKLLADSLARYFDKEYAFDRRRKLMLSELGFSREHWAQFAELGLLGIGTSEDQGGTGGGPVETMIVMEAIGRHLVVEPYFASVVLAGALLRGANAASHLGALAAGKLLLSVAHSEPRSRFDLTHVATRAEHKGDGFKLSGHKAVALNADAADRIVVSARTAGAVTDPNGITLFLLPRDTAGMSLTPYRTVDGLRAADLKLDGVLASRGMVLGEIDQAHGAIERAAEHAIVALSAEAAGAMGSLVSLTREYLKTRKQFGVPIGSFQVLQHRLVDMFMAHELTRATVQAAVQALMDGDADYRARTAAAAKVQAGRAGRLVGQEAVQLHGGMGMTDELAVGSYFKRLAAIDISFGNADWHQRRFADLSLGQTKQ